MAKQPPPAPEAESNAVKSSEGGGGGNVDGMTQLPLSNDNPIKKVEKKKYINYRKSFYS